MLAGLTLALAFLRAYEEDTPEVFADQLTADFRFQYLPPVMGAGPMQARRWCALLHSIYRTWRCEVIDASEAEGEILVRAEWSAADPTAPDLATTSVDTVMFKFTLSGGRLASCDALFADFVEQRDEDAKSAPTAKQSDNGGLDLVLRHLRAYEARSPELFDEQVGDGFRYSHLMPVLGAGPAHARRWYDLLYSVYRTWTVTIVDAFEAHGDVIVRTSWRATDPIDPGSEPEFHDSCALRYTVRDGKIASCDCVCLDYAEMQMENASAA
jgi:hypothetical protein